VGEISELLPCPPQTVHDLENIEKFVEAAFAAYNFRPHEFFPHFGRRLIDAVKELNRRAEAPQAPGEAGRWFDLTGDARLGACATDGCGGQPTKRLEAGGVGANYCSGCADKIRHLATPSAPLPAGTVTDEQIEAKFAEIRNQLDINIEYIERGYPSKTPALPHIIVTLTGHVRDRLNELEAAFAARPAEPVAVKGLESGLPWPGDDLDQLLSVLENIEYVAHNNIRADGMKTIHDFAQYAMGIVPRIRSALISTPAPGLVEAPTFQDRVAKAHVALFDGDPTDLIERRDRFVEEANEVGQVLGMTREEAHQLVDYTYGRPVGEPEKEIGAAMVTLASICVVGGWNMQACAEADLAKLRTPETIARIRAKRATRHGRGPLPGLSPASITETGGAK
jgi:hypothetical protein